MKKMLIALLFCLVSSSAFASASLYANDGKYLGEVGGSKYDSNSISNEYGQYGSKYSSDSVNNPYGEYGSKYSQNSPNNPYASSKDNDSEN